jgi:hypothetical protein
MRCRVHWIARPKSARCDADHCINESLPANVFSLPRRFGALAVLRDAIAVLAVCRQAARQRLR